jgi:hypothetical protein
MNVEFGTPEGYIEPTHSVATQPVIADHALSTCHRPCACRSPSTRSFRFPALVIDLSAR